MYTHIGSEYIKLMGVIDSSMYSKSRINLCCGMGLYRKIDDNKCVNIINKIAEYTVYIWI
jgi:hypothetical protein